MATPTLDGRVNDDEVTILGALYDKGRTTGHHWYEGVFNFDQKIDDNDVTILGALYDRSAPALSVTYLASLYGGDFAAAFERGQMMQLPEPGVVLLGVMAGALALRRRRR